MEKNATLNLRVNPDVKRRAEEVLSVLGIPMSTAIDMYLKQIGLTGGIPFPVTIPRVPAEIDMDQMSTGQSRSKLDAGYEEAISGKTVDATEAFDRFRKDHSK